MKRRRKDREAHSHAIPWVVLCIVCALCVGVYAAYQGIMSQVDTWLEDLPSLEHIDDYADANKTLVYANDNETILAEFYLEDRTPVDLGGINQSVLDATIATEDARFSEHNGVDLHGIVRAAWNNLVGGRVEGASTITQQLVRNTVLADEASEITYRRKVREIELATELEKKKSKDEILNLYLNTINYGDNCYGIQAAALHYFSIPASELSITQAATLAGIPQSPSTLTPTIHPENCLERRNMVLERMFTCGYIDRATYDAACATGLGLAVAPEAPADGIFAYPYFTSYIRNQLENEYSTAEVFRGGLTVTTTLDPGLQNAAEQAAQMQYESMDESLDVSLTCINPENGHVVAMIGGRDYYADQYNLATQAQRQAGSSFKTFTLTTAIEQGINPSTNIDCTDGAYINGWTVHNINNVNYGTRSIQSAFAVSSNTGFARLQQVLGNDTVREMAQRMGITSELESVDSLTLGTQGVTTLEMADAYATLAAQGVHHDAVSILRIVNKDGVVIYDHVDEGTQVVSENVASAAVKVMQTVFTQGTATAARLSSGQPVAGKTGTSEEYRDQWLCGFTPQLCCATWIGAREEAPGASADCSALWKSFMDMALDGTEIQPFPVTADPHYNKGLVTNGMAVSQPSSSSSSSDSSSSPSYSEEDPDGDGYAYVPSSQVPNTSGESLAEAASSLDGYFVEYVEEHSSTVPAGCVIYQEITASGYIRLHVSSG